MRKAELLKRIEDLERRLAAAEQRLATMTPVFAPAQPFIGPTVLPYPQVVPAPVWPPGFVPHPTIVSFDGVVATAEPPLCPYPIGEDRATVCAPTSFVALAGVDPRTLCGTAVAMQAGPAMCIGAASASQH